MSNDQVLYDLQLALYEGTFLQKMEACKKLFDNFNHAEMQIIYDLIDQAQKLVDEKMEKKKIAQEILQKEYLDAFDRWSADELKELSDGTTSIIIN